MKKHSVMKKLIPIFLTILLLILAMPFMVSAATSVSVPLIAGQDTEIGSVTVSDNGSVMTVKYQVTAEGWFLTQTHLYVGLTPPAKASPGQFPYSHPLDYVTEDTFEIPITDGTQYFVAAHAVASEFTGWDCPTIAEISAMLPSCGHIVGLNSSTPDTMMMAFTNSGILNGTRSVWCIDESHYIWFEPTEYNANFYSSLIAMPSYLTTGTDPNIDHPENLDLVNWVLNNRSGFTRTEVQNVIWHLIDANPLNPLTPNEQILYGQALTHDGFIPDFCAGQVMGVVIAPVANCGDTTAIAQAMLVEIGFPCTPTYGSDTAWGQAGPTAGVPFKTGWGTYFTYTP